MKTILKQSFLSVVMLLTITMSHAQIALIGDNTPHKVMNDGDFDQVWANWRKGKKPPFWTIQTADKQPSTGDKTHGLHYGKMYSNNPLAIAESELLNTNPQYTHPTKGDIIHWEIGADLEYDIQASLDLSLVFGERESILAKGLKLKGADLENEIFKGKYCVSAQDQRGGIPFIRLTMYSGDGVKIFIDYINIWVERKGLYRPSLSCKNKGEEIQLSWIDKMAKQNAIFDIYRMTSPKSGYQKIAESSDCQFVDREFTSGITNNYVVVRRVDNIESATSNVVAIANCDEISPEPPTQLKATIFDSEIALTWKRSKSVDVKNYSIFRGDADLKSMVEIACISNYKFEDIYVPKGDDVSYVIYANDYSGNRSIASEPIKARVKLVPGSAFSDLICPMPVREPLEDNLWGVNSVLPRDPNNGIESPDWSYWGGRPVYDKNDGKYHMVVTRWPESAIKGHWEWPKSTVAQTVSDDAIGPYKVVKDIAYDFHDGMGHNPDIILLNDGTYALYSLVNWEPTIFVSKTMQGPWKKLGVITINDIEFSSSNGTYFRNLSGVQLEDESIIIVTKIGRMIRSTQGLLGPYDVVNPNTIQQNTTIPLRYRNSGYEDPVMWRDEAQFHLMINAQNDKRAIYLRSADGINWQYNPGLAYTPAFTIYENGAQNYWDKLERPHVVTDEYGRATHLSLAVVDVPKEVDYGNDNHNSKNIILPLRISKRIELLTTDAIDHTTPRITILIKSEAGFDATKDIDIKSLRYGAPSEVDYGRGCKADNSFIRGNDLVVEFNGDGNGVTESDFVCKLIGNDVNGELLFGYNKVNQ